MSVQTDPIVEITIFFCDDTHTIIDKKSYDIIAGSPLYELKQLITLDLKVRNTIRHMGIKKSCDFVLFDVNPKTQKETRIYTPRNVPYHPKQKLYLYHVQSFSDQIDRKLSIQDTIDHKTNYDVDKFKHIKHFVFCDTSSVRNVINNIAHLSHAHSDTMFIIGTCVSRELLNKGFEPEKIEMHPTFQNRFEYVESDSCEPVRVAVYIEAIYDTFLANREVKGHNKSSFKKTIKLPSTYRAFWLDQHIRNEFDSVTNDIHILLEFYNFVRNTRRYNSRSKYSFWTDDALLFELFDNKDVKIMIKEFGICHDDDVDVCVSFRP